MNALMKELYVHTLQGKHLYFRPVAELYAKVFMVSFPKSGRTWMENLVWAYIKSGGNTSIEKTEHFIATHDCADDPWQDHLTYRDLHEAFKPKIYRDKKLIFLVRDPKDVVVSYFWQKTVREPWLLPQTDNYERWLRDNCLEKDFHFKGNISEFIRDDIYGIKKIVRFMNLWAEELIKHQKCLVVAYEDLRKDDFGVFLKILEFIGAKTDEELARKVIDEWEFARAKAREKKRESAITDDNQMKRRKGKIGGYVDELSETDIEYLNKYIREHLHTFFARYL